MAGPETHSLPRFYQRLLRRLLDLRRPLSQPCPYADCGGTLVAGTCVLCGRTPETPARWG